MPATYVREVLERASILLNDLDPQFTRWTEREMVAWFNDGARALAKWIPQSCARVDVIKLAAGTRQNIASILTANILPGDGDAAANTYGTQLYSVVRNMGTAGSTPGKAIAVVERAALDAAYPDWHTASASVIENYVIDARTPTIFYVSPGVTGSVWAEISYCALPKVITLSAANQFAKDSTDTTLITVGDAYADDILNYVVARAYLKDSETPYGVSMAQAFTEMFVASINAQVTALTGNNPNLKMLPFAPTPNARAS